MAVLQEYLANKHALDNVLKEVETLVSIPEVYLKFRQLMDQPNATLPDYTQVVSCDPKLTALVLKLINSPLYGFSGRVAHLDDAIRLLGLNKLHDMVLAASMIKLDYPNDIMPIQLFWRCSLFSGIFARLLGKKLRVDDSESLFVIGLLHKIGCLVLYSKYPQEAKKALAKAKEDNQPIHAAELAILGFHYGHAGAKLMALWRLPVDFQVLTYYQPTPLDAPMLQQKTALLHVVHSYAKLYIHGDEIDIEQTISPEVWTAAGCQPGEIKDTLKEARESALDIEKMVLG